MNVAVDVVDGSVQQFFLAEETISFDWHCSTWLNNQNNFTSSASATFQSSRKRYKRERNIPLGDNSFTAFSINNVRGSNVSCKNQNSSKTVTSYNNFLSPTPFIRNDISPKDFSKSLNSSTSILAEPSSPSSSSTFQSYQVQEIGFSPFQLISPREPHNSNVTLMSGEKRHYSPMLGNESDRCFNLQFVNGRDHQRRNCYVTTDPVSSRLKTGSYSLKKRLLQNTSEQHEESNLGLNLNVQYQRHWQRYDLPFALVRSKTRHTKPQLTTAGKEKLFKRPTSTNQSLTVIQKSPRTQAHRQLRQSSQENPRIRYVLVERNGSHSEDENLEPKITQKSAGTKPLTAKTDEVECSPKAGEMQTVISCSTRELIPQNPLSSVESQRIRKKPSLVAMVHRWIRGGKAQKEDFDPRKMSLASTTASTPPFGSSPMYRSADIESLNHRNIYGKFYENNTCQFSYDRFNTRGVHQYLDEKSSSGKGNGYYHAAKESITSQRNSSHVFVNVHSLNKFPVEHGYSDHEEYFHCIPRREKLETFQPLRNVIPVCHTNVQGRLLGRKCREATKVQRKGGIANISTNNQQNYDNSQVLIPDSFEQRRVSLSLNKVNRTSGKRIFNDHDHAFVSMQEQPLESRQPVDHYPADSQFWTPSCLVAQCDDQRTFQDVWKCYDNEELLSFLESPDFEVHLARNCLYLMDVRIHRRIEQITTTTLKMLRSCRYQPSDILQCVALALCQFENLRSKLQLDDPLETIYIFIIQIFLSHCWLLDETCPIHEWHKYIFTDYCTFSNLNWALMYLFNYQGFRLACDPDLVHSVVHQLVIPSTQQLPSIGIQGPDWKYGKQYQAVYNR